VTTYRCTPRTLDSALRRLIRDKEKELQGDALEVVTRGVAHAVALTNADGLVDQAAYKRGWRAKRIPGGASLDNAAPHAGVLERGRRPGARRPPLAPILAWVKRKFPAATGRKKDISAEHRRIAFAVQAIIGKRGTKPHFVMRRTRKAMQEWWRAAVRKRIGR
jgi:hypothetical protein